MTKLMPGLTDAECIRRELSDKRLKAWAKRLELERRLESLLVAHGDIGWPTAKKQLEEEIAGAKERIAEVESEIWEIQAELGNERVICPACQTRQLRMNYALRKENPSEEPIAIDSGADIAFLSCANGHNFIILSAGETGLHQGMDMLLSTEDIERILTQLPKPGPVN